MQVSGYRLETTYLRPLTMIIDLFLVIIPLHCLLLIMMRFSVVDIGYSFDAIIEKKRANSPCLRYVTFNLVIYLLNSLLIVCVSLK